MTEAPVCQHLRLKPDLSATTSVIAIETHLWGVICEGCGAKWDIGQVLQAIPDLAAARRNQWMTLPNEDGEGGVTWRAWAADLDMQRLEAEDRVAEMQREIMFLPQPPPEAGDGPFERVQATLETLTALYGKIAGLENQQEKTP